MRVAPRAPKEEKWQEDDIQRAGSASQPADLESPDV